MGKCKPIVVALTATVTFLAVVLSACGTTGTASSSSPPPPPPGSHTVDLSWTASGSLVDGYRIYRSTQQGLGYQPINASLISVTWFTDSDVQSGQTYYYVMTAVDAQGAESVFSNEAAAAIPIP
jgi:hypothetical protein